MEVLVAERAYDSESLQGRMCRRQLKSSTRSHERCVCKRPERGCHAKTGLGCGERRKVVRAFVRLGDSHGLLVRHSRYPGILRVFSLVTSIGVSLGRS